MAALTGISLVHLPKHPQLVAGYLMCFKACKSASLIATPQLVEWAERGISVADDVNDNYHGAFLRYNLGDALIDLASNSGIGVQAGRLRRLLTEAEERAARCKPWLVGFALSA